MTEPVGWTPPPRPDWLVRFNEEAAGMAEIPLDADELIRTARQETGFDDFGRDDRWREPYGVLLRAIGREARLHPFGRLMVRTEILNWLKALLGIEAAFQAFPAIADEVVDRPLIIAALPRSGSSILFELLSQDPQFGSPRQWEMMFPYPPPEAEQYETDPRIERCQHLITQWERVAPSLATIHKMDARLPNECIFAQAPCFVSEYILTLFQVPSYVDWLVARADWEYAYGFYRRVLQLLQFRNPRRHWLLKAPSHLNYLPVIFKVFPDARVLFTHRDPVVAQASVIDLMGTLFWLRSDKVMEVKAFEGMLSPESMAAGCDRVIDWLESGTIPPAQCASSLYANLITEPRRTVQRVYEKTGIDYTPEAAARIERYLAAKPQGKFGRHRYGLAEAAEIGRLRGLFRRYQEYFQVPNEV